MHIAKNSVLSLLWACFILSILLPSHGAAADDDLWAELQKGGKVVLMRHASTDAREPVAFAPDDCSTQRNLSEKGRKEAKLVGQAFMRHAVPISDVLASPFCRTRDTAKAAFGRVQIWQPLNLLVGLSDAEKESRTAIVTERIASFSGPGNLVLITHRPNIDDLTFEVVKPGEFLILKPDGQSELEIIGRIAPDGLTDQ